MELTVNACRYMDKRLLLQLNGNRKVTGVLRGFDPFMNVVLDETIKEASPEERTPMGLVVFLVFKNA